MQPRSLIAQITLCASLLASGNACSFELPIAALQAGTQVKYALGAVVDVRRPNTNGITVLAVTPGGAADRIGLHPGDQLIVVNGQRLDRTSTPSAMLENALQQGGGTLRIEVMRNGEALLLFGHADQGSITATTPVDTAPCGYVSTAGPVSKIGQGIHDAAIASIDGRSTPLDTRNRYRLSAGRHVLVVSEEIDEAHLTSFQIKSRLLVLSRLQERANKVLVVDIKPGTRLRVGAQLLRDKLDSQSMRDNLYWQPVAWQEPAGKCP